MFAITIFKHKRSRLRNMHVLPHPLPLMPPLMSWRPIPSQMSCLLSELSSDTTDSVLTTPLYL